MHPRCQAVAFCVPTSVCMPFGSLVGRKFTCIMTPSNPGLWEFDPDNNLKVNRLARDVLAGPDNLVFAYHFITSIN